MTMGVKPMALQVLRAGTLLRDRHLYMSSEDLERFDRLLDSESRVSTPGSVADMTTGT